MEQFNFPFSRLSINELPENIQQLVHAAEKAIEQAYAPYSHFKVGAALLLSDGTVRTGANHENASFPAGICAERAVLATLDMNETAPKVVAIAISYKGGHINMPLSPCGICRQSILEVQLAQQTPVAVYMSSPEEKIVMVEDAAYLLPFYFSNANL